MKPRKERKKLRHLKSVSLRPSKILLRRVLGKRLKKRGWRSNSRQKERLLRKKKLKIGRRREMMPCCWLSKRKPVRRQRQPRKLRGGKEMMREEKRNGSNRKMTQL